MIRLEGLDVLQSRLCVVADLGTELLARRGLPDEESVIHTPIRGRRKRENVTVMIFLSNNVTYDRAMPLNRSFQASWAGANERIFFSTSAV